ncbi:hypothetical protein IXB50_01460 [Leptothoe spongobia TAU-MAC 1115]|uniref:DUF6916 domain-containing protein n=2 Tax=Leptothoe TaxID=2651725 RepID=A0A947DDT0_9CYAN|nr:hypothetical protein [Leptothoe spongobia TAU-MAC 1115]
MGSFAVSLFVGGDKSLGVATAKSLAGESNLSNLNANIFQPLKGKDFQLQINGQTIPVKLAKVEEYRQYAKTDAFSLVFHSRGNETLEQGTYHVSHPKLGEMKFFMVPSPGKRSGQNYVVTINHYLG